MSQSPNPDEVRAALDPIWLNAFWIKNALGLYEGVSKHADELSVNYDHFFGVIQRISLDYAVLGICKLYDKGSLSYQKDTVIELFSYLKTHLVETYVIRAKVETLTALGMPKPNAEQILEDLRSGFDVTRITFLQNINSLMPSKEPHSPLDKLFTYRNKILAHQERLDQFLRTN